MSDAPLPKVTHSIELATYVERALFNAAIIQYLYHVRDIFALNAHASETISDDIPKYLVNNSQPYEKLLSLYNINTIDVLQFAKNSS